MKKSLGFVFIPLVALSSITLPRWLANHATPAVAEVVAPRTPAVTGQAVTAGVAGRLWQLYVVPGQRVQRGEMIAKLATTLPARPGMPPALAFEYVVAPANGTVASQVAETGDYLTPTTTVILLQSTEQVSR